VQPVQDRFQECIGCYICIEVCGLLTDYDAIRMYDVDLVEPRLGVAITDRSRTSTSQPSLMKSIFLRAERTACDIWERAHASARK
jgi:Fe-S-cluster-containing hydrogenase component 2